ncbi:MAG: right-handed parallel beta-helix repeat-containing protein [Verrucomicrobia bacterium]|nr:right-handed parallel beta-helix repeat-containing protein [Verrucomicrobiota bacterium]
MDNAKNGEFMKLLLRHIALAGLFCHALPAADALSAAASRESRTTVYLDSGDGAAINEAIRTLPPAGGVVILGPSLFPIAEAVVIDRDGIELRGTAKQTLLKLAERVNCPVIVVGSTATPPARIVRNITVGHLVIDGSRASQQHECYGGDCDNGGLTHIRNNGITVRGAEDVRIEQIGAHSCRSGGVVLEKGCRRIHITGLEAHDNEFDGLACYETEDSLFEQLNLHHNRSAGLSLDWRFNRNVIRDSTFGLNGSQGIFMRDSNENRFRNLHLRDNGEQGVFIAETREIPGTPCRDNRFERLTVMGNKTQGIRVNDASCTGNLILHSRITGNALENLSLAAPDLLLTAETAPRGE